jgi:hypothetical protein
MLIRIDRQSAQRFVYHTEDRTQDIRRYYCAATPHRAIIVCRNGLDLIGLVDRVVDARVGNDQGVRGFVRERNVGRRHSKITIYHVSQKTRFDATLAGVLSKAPCDTSTPPDARSPKASRAGRLVGR